MAFDEAHLNDFDIDCALAPKQLSKSAYEPHRLRIHPRQDNMTRRLLMGALGDDPSGPSNPTKQQKSSSQSVDNNWLNTERSMAGNALIHDMSNTINSQSDSDSDKDDKGRKNRGKADDSDSDSSYGVEVSNDTLVRSDGDLEADGIEMTQINRKREKAAAKRAVRRARKKLAKKLRKEAALLDA